VKLIVVGGDAAAEIIPLQLPTTIGRGRDAVLRLPHPLVSRMHCELIEVDNRLIVRDLGSLNGTYVGTERVTEAALPPGELLTLGAITFRVTYDTSPDSDETDLPAGGRPDSSTDVRRGQAGDADDSGAAPTDGPPGADSNRKTQLQVGEEPPDEADDVEGDRGLFFT
jgi:pSer/pThr/pTyr-binding forkhead associated (FHA) protein